MLNMTRKMFHLAVATWLLVNSAGSIANEAVYDMGDLIVSKVFSTEMPSSAHVAAVYFEVENKGSLNDSLLSVSSPIGESALVHRVANGHEGIEMSPQKLTVIAPGQTLRLMPGGDHVMVLNVSKGVKAGDSFPLELNFENAGTVVVNVPVVSR